MPLKTLTTNYNGQKFRSPLEARWAVFFDTAGIEYLYDPEGFDLGDDVAYLPDFFLRRGIRFLGEEQPRRNVWVAIKTATELPEDERQTIISFVQETGENILLIAGDPGLDADFLFIQQIEDGQLDAADVAFMELADGQTGLVAERELLKLERSEDRALVERRIQTGRLVEAYSAAREARFGRRMKRCERCGREFQPKDNRYSLCYACQQRKSVPPGMSVARRRSPQPKDKSAGGRLSPGLPPGRRRIVIALLAVVTIGLMAWSACQVADLSGAMFELVAGRSNARPTETPSLPPTYTPVPTQAVIMEGLAPGMGGTRSWCSCTEDRYDCSDFQGPDEAQACFDLCRPAAGDVHLLDEDGDGQVCAGP